MRRFLSLFTVLMLSSVLAFSQTRVVSGKVTESNGNPVPFASVTVKGTKSGVSADPNGAYTIRVKDGDVLVISASGFKTIEVPIAGGLTAYNTTLDRSNELTEVVVTSAFQTKRTARATASNVQTVSADKLNTIRQPNINNAIAGKVAGAQVRSQSAAALGRETLVRLRGENGIGVGGGALYVVDGTIMPSGNDINVDDVEDVTVLQGPAAAALFGPDGSNGAIVVTTKKGKKTQKNLGIEINSGITFDQIYILPNYQNSYGGGYDRDLTKYTWQPGHPEGWKALDGKYYHDYTGDESWGPRMVGQEYISWDAWYGGHEGSFKTSKMVPQPNNARDYFNTGVLKQNNVNFSKGGDDYTFRMSYTNLDQSGLIPSSYLKKHNFGANVTLDLTKRITLGINANYINQKTNAENDDSYANNSTGSFNQWFHRNIDMNTLKRLRGLKTPEGIMATWNHNNPGTYNPNNPLAFYGAYFWFNPFDWQDNVLNYNNRDRVFGDASLTFKATNDLSLKFTYRKNQLNTNSDIRQYRNLQNSASSNLAGFGYWEAINGRSATWQGFGLGSSRSNRQNYEFLATYKKKIRDIQINANAGVDILKTEAEAFNANTMGGLVIPDVFILSNSRNNINQANTITRFGRRGAFVRADVGYKNYLFLEGTYRTDYTSAERPGTSINTKSIGASFVFSDLIKDKVPFLSYGKLRASAGDVLSALGAYSRTQLYGINPQQWNGNLLMTEPDRLIDPALHGVSNVEKELGIDLRFLKNRVGISATYWDRTNKDFPINTSIYGGSGYSGLATNAGEVAKTGIDVQVTLNPIKSKNFDWNIAASWGRLLKNDVIRITDDVKRLTLAGGQAGTSAYVVSEEGQRWGQLRGIGYKRVNGVPVLDNHGLFVPEEEVNLGSTIPDYTGGVQNSFNILKNFNINVNIDYSFGGKTFSLSQWYGTSSGLLEHTATVNDKGIPVRDKVADGGGFHVFGVDEVTGKPVDYYVEGQTYFQQFAYGAGIAEPFVYDMTFVKMREVSLSYRVPLDHMNIGKFIKGATFSIISRNPWLIYSGVKGFDPSEMTTVLGEDGQLPGTRSFGMNLKLNF